MICELFPFQKQAGNLSRHSDTRQYTIWETIENTAREDVRF